jgi:hypothetical protein
VGPVYDSQLGFSVKMIITIHIPLNASFGRARVACRFALKLRDPCTFVQLNMYFRHLFSLPFARQNDAYRKVTPPHELGILSASILVPL